MYHFQEHLKIKKLPKDISNIPNIEKPKPIIEQEYTEITEKVNRIHFTDQISKLKINKP